MGCWLEVPHARLYGSSIGIAALQISIYCNAQVCIWRWTNNPTPDRITGYVFNAAPKRGLAMLNEIITEKAGVVVVIHQFKILMVPMLIVSPLAQVLCKRYVRG